MSCAISRSNELSPYATASAISFALKDEVNCDGGRRVSAAALNITTLPPSSHTHLAMQFGEKRKRDPATGGIFRDDESSDAVLLLVVDQDLICRIRQLGVVWWDLGQDRLAGWGKYEGQSRCRPLMTKGERTVAVLSRALVALGEDGVFSSDECM
jgi:hypothetical protein